MNKKIIGGLVALSLLSAVAYATTERPDVDTPTQEEQDDDNKEKLNVNTSVSDNLREPENDIVNIHDQTVKQAIANEIYNDETKDVIYQVDINSKLNSNSKIIKLVLNKDAKNLNDIACLNGVQDLWIINATNDNFNWEGLKSLKSIKSLTIINCTLNPSDISNTISYLINKGYLEELYLNAAFPGNEAHKNDFKQITGNGANAYISALNDLNTNGLKLKTLSLIGNSWQGDIVYLDKLKNSGCAIALDSNSQVQSNDKNVHIFYNKE